jgi:hypothetical protein
MDAKERDDPKIRRREETLARRVGQALDKLNPDAAGDCPDAEVIAAYAEQALAPGESAQWENHFAACARCRKILRVLAVSGEAPLAEIEIAHLGELISAARATSESKKESTTQSLSRPSAWRLRWLVPATGVAAVLVTWFALRPPWRAKERSAAPTLIAQAPKNEPQPISPAPPADRESLQKVPAADQESKLKQLDKGLVSHLPSQNLRTLPPAKRPLAQSAEPLISGADKVAPLGEAKKEGSPGTPRIPSGVPAVPAQVASRSTAALAVPASPPPQSSGQTEGAAPLAKEVPSPAAQSVTVTEAAPLVETTNGALSNGPGRDKTAGAAQDQQNTVLSGTAGQTTGETLPVNGRNFQALTALKGTPGNTRLLRAPSGSVQWLAGRNGQIYRSNDGGRNWSPQGSPLSEDWLAGAAVSDTICWLAGRNGAIALTIDGEHWLRIDPPARAGVAGGKFSDLIAISALDAQSATVTTGDGRRFATSDGGATWQTQ